MSSLPNGLNWFHNKQDQTVVINKRGHSYYKQSQTVVIMKETKILPKGTIIIYIKRNYLKDQTSCTKRDQRVFIYQKRPKIYHVPKGTKQHHVPKGTKQHHVPKGTKQLSCTKRDQLSCTKRDQSFYVPKETRVFMYQKGPNSYHVPNRIKVIMYQKGSNS